MASGILVISLLHFPFFSPLYFHFFPVINPAREDPQNCNWLSWIEQPSQAETHQQIDITTQMMPTHIYILGCLDSRNPNPKHSETYCEAFTSSPSVPFKLFFFFCAKDVWSCVTRQITNRIWGCGLGFLHAVILRILLRHTSVSKWCIFGRSCHMSRQFASLWAGEKKKLIHR